jgi:hypothetical protein
VFHKMRKFGFYQHLKKRNIELFAKFVIKYELLYLQENKSVIMHKLSFYSLSLNQRIS